MEKFSSRALSLARNVKPVRHFLPALLFGASLGIFVHGYWLIDIFPVGGRSLLFFTLLTALCGTGIYTLLFLWLTNAFSGLSNRQKAGLLAAGLSIGAGLFFMVTEQWVKPFRLVSFFLPTHTLEITVPPEQNKDDISISWISTSLGDTSYETIDYSGWKISKDRLVLTNIADNHLRWIGKTGSEVQIVFENPSQNGYVLLSWDGQESIIQLPRKKNTYSHAFNIPFYASSDLTLFLGILNFSLLALPLCFLVWKKRAELLQAVHQGFSPEERRIDRREWIVVVALMALAFALRVPNLDILFPGVEEYSHINAAKQIIQGVPLGDVYQRSLWLVTIPVSLMFRLFGYQLWAARLLGVIFNTLAVIPLYLVTRKMNRPVAILSVLLFATSPWIIALSRNVREYAYYPFYYLWIVYAMILFVEEIPERFQTDKDVKILWKPKVLFLGSVLAFPLIYALRIDPLSTFQVIRIAYLSLGFIIILKMDFRYWKNLFLLIIVFMITAYLWKVYIPALTKVNWVPLDYFFLNSTQQWYFNRVSIIPLTGFLGTILVAILLWRINSVPLFLYMLYGGSMGYFMLSTNQFFAPRHVSTTQLWYVILIAISLYLIWLFLQTFSLLKGKGARILTVVVMAGLVINFRQVLVPIISKDPYMPITQDYYNDLTDLQSYMLANVRPGDVLISSRIYSRYVEWVGEPAFREVYDFQVQSTEKDVLSIVDRYDSGWIIIDNARIERAVFSPDVVFLENDRIEYVGLFDDEHVWRWRVK